jgi:hypothetical protein
VSERAARWCFVALVLTILGVGALVDLPALSGRRFWGDGATYYAMAWSLAEDGDLRFDERDLYRVRREYPSGPQGVFLKRSSRGFTHDGRFPWLRRVPEDAPLVYYAKPFAYSLAAAPLVRLFGTRGLTIANALGLALTLAFAWDELRRRCPAAWALAGSAVLVLATVAPVYLIWPTPELFNMAAVAGSLWAWRRGRPRLAAAVLGVAIYSKPYNLLLALPLGLQPLLQGAGPLTRRTLESARRAAIVAGVTAGLFALNAAITGEANYQGGRERKTFYEKFPGDVETVDGLPRKVTFGNAGIWMSTNQAGPRVLGEDDRAPSQGAEPARAPEELRQSFLHNLAYFWVGRLGGAVPYFFPAVWAALLLGVLGPRPLHSLLALVALLASYLFYILMIPDNWYGGTGTVGNRYFLNLLPLAVLMLPPGRERLATLGGLAGLVFVGPILASPLGVSLHHGSAARSGALRLLPAELSMLNDLAVFSEPWRKKVPIGDTEGDAHKHWPADPRAYYLYFPDDGTYGREAGAAGPGFWLRAGRHAEVIVRALEPVGRMRVELTGGPLGDEVAAVADGREQRAALGPDEAATLSFEPRRPFVYKDSFVYVLRLRSTRGGHAAGDARELGCFVRIELEVEKRPRAKV